MACCGGSLTPEEKEAAANNKRIEKQIARDKKVFNSTIKLLLLGAGESGKSTFAKQMKIIHMNGFKEEEKMEYVDLIRDNILVGIKSLVDAAKSFAIPLEPANEPRASSFAALPYSKLSNVEFNAELVADIKSLWGDPGITKTLLRRDEFQLSDSVVVYLNDIDRIAAPDFVPTIPDILRVRSKTTGIVETEFKIKDSIFKMVDVGGQRNERAKWIHCFEDVTAIIFFVSLNGYNQVLEEDDSVNRMHEALTLFRDTINHKFFRRTNIILFLNKLDLFEVKITKVDLKVCFEDYTGGLDAAKAIEFLTARFKDQDKSAGESSREIYVYPTTATDTGNIKKVFNAVQDILMRAMLEAI